MQNYDSPSKDQLSPWQYLVIRGALFYVALIALLLIVAAFFQLWAGIDAKLVMVSVVSNAIGLSLAIWIYRRKRSLKEAVLLEWLVAFWTMAMPTMVRWQYVMKYDWLYGMQSYHISALTLLLLIALQFFYKRRMFLFFAGLVFAHWAFFWYMAHSQGVPIQGTVVNGDVNHGFVFLQEAYFFIVLLLVTIISYRNINTVIRLHEQNEARNRLMHRQMLVQDRIINVIQDRMDRLTKLLREQDQVINDFHYKIEHQASTFEELSATIEELQSSAESMGNIARDQLQAHQTLEQTLENYQNVKSETSQNLDTTRQGVIHMLSKSGQGRDSIGHVENTMTEIEKQSKNISDTVTLIIEIADKINLLSLNASIEAARAGEAGRGFAVVADEVGKLANQTTDSVKQIEGVLRASSEITGQGVTTIKETAQLIRGMIEDMEESSAKLERLKSSLATEEEQVKIFDKHADETANLARAIDSSTSEQSQALSESVGAVEKVSGEVHEMVSGVQKIRDTSQQILSHAEELMAEADRAQSIRERLNREQK